METLTLKDFQNNMVSVFDRTDKGEHIVICVGSRKYALSVLPDDDEVSPQLRKTINEGTEEFLSGKTIHCANKEELHAFLDAL